MEEGSGLVAMMVALAGRSRCANHWHVALLALSCRLPLPTPALLAHARDILPYSCSAPNGDHK